MKTIQLVTLHLINGEKIIIKEDLNKRVPETILFIFQKKTERCLYVEYDTNQFICIDLKNILYITIAR